MLYPLSYGGAPTLATGSDTPDSVETVIYLRLETESGAAWLGACCTPSPAPLRRDRASPHPLRERLARPTRLAAVVASPARERHRPRPRLSGELSPLPGRIRAGLLSVAAVVARPRGARSLTCCFVRTTCVWQSGSSSGARAPATVCPGCLVRCDAEGETRTPTLLTRTRPST